jgi:RPA family protein
MSLRQREVARRLFAKELNESTLFYKEHEDTYAPQYLLTPTGAKCNRVFVVGTLTEKENVGVDSDYWRARIADPTGVFPIYAGQYQQQAVTQLSAIEVPAFVAVIGKLNVFHTDDGPVKVSIRPEFINVVDSETRNKWVLETAEKTLGRIERLQRDGEDVAKAREYYSTDASLYIGVVIEAVKALKQEYET